MKQRIKNSEHERRFVTYRTKIGTNHQFCSIRYVGHYYTILYNFSKHLKISNQRILKIETVRGVVEYERN